MIILSSSDRTVREKKVKLAKCKNSELIRKQAALFF